MTRTKKLQIPKSASTTIPPYILPNAPRHYMHSLIRYAQIQTGKKCTTPQSTIELNVNRTYINKGARNLKEKAGLATKACVHMHARRQTKYVFGVHDVRTQKFSSRGVTTKAHFTKTPKLTTTSTVHHPTAPCLQKFNTKATQLKEAVSSLNTCTYNYEIYAKWLQAHKMQLHKPPI